MLCLHCMKNVLTELTREEARLEWGPWEMEQSARLFVSSKQISKFTKPRKASVIMRPLSLHHASSKLCVNQDSVSQNCFKSKFVDIILKVWKLHVVNLNIWVSYSQQHCDENMVSRTRNTTNQDLCWYLYMLCSLDVWRSFKALELTLIFCFYPFEFLNEYLMTTIRPNYNITLTRPTSSILTWTFPLLSIPSILRRY